MPLQRKWSAKRAQVRSVRGEGGGGGGGAGSKQSELERKIEGCEQSIVHERTKTINII